MIGPSPRLGRSSEGPVARRKRSVSTPMEMTSTGVSSPMRLIDGVREVLADGGDSSCATQRPALELVLDAAVGAVDVSAVGGDDEGFAGDLAQQRANNALRHEPVGVDDVDVLAAHDAAGGEEFGEEEDGTRAQSQRLRLRLGSMPP